jgi:hypothetical protein
VTENLKNFQNFLEVNKALANDGIASRAVGVLGVRRFHLSEGKERIERSRGGMRFFFC